MSVDTTQRIIKLEGSNYTRTAVLTSNAWVYIFFKTIIFSVCVFVCVCLWTRVSASVHEGLKRTSGSLGRAGSWEPSDMGAGSGCWETGLKSSVEATSNVLKFALSMAVRGVACFPPPLTTLNIIAVLFMPIG